MKIKVVIPNFRFPIRVWVPYALFSMITSRFLLKFILRSVDEKDVEFISQLDPKVLRGVIASIKKFKGTEIVNVKDKEGTEVKITL